jgi:hypothetical protein
MPYSDFKSLKSLEKQFGITYQFDHIFDQITPVNPSHYLLHDLEEAQDYPTYPSEKAKSELMIMPVIKEIKRNNPTFQVFSGFNFDVDYALGLNGFCDFLFSKEPKILEIESPVFCVVEAKDKTVEEGFAQAAAEMYAAILFNEKDGKPTPTVYGCVTNSDVWVFLRLTNKQLTIDETRYYLVEPSISNLLGVFRKIVESF